MSAELSGLSVPLDRDLFLRSLLRELSGTLEDVVGLAAAEGYISVVGRTIGAALDRQYRSALGAERLSAEQIAAVLVDLKRRIEGGFRIESVEAGRIVLTNTACPFGDKVSGRPSLCMMTLNVFGTIAAENAGYARVAIPEAIANGAAGCRVVVDLDPARIALPESRDFFRSGL